MEFAFYLENKDNFIYNKDITTPVVNNVIGGQVDIMPTLCYLMGVDENKYMLGIF